MADKILQNPGLSKIFDKNSLSELFELPKKTINKDRERFTLDNYKEQKEIQQEIEEEYNLVQKQTPPTDIEDG